MDYKEDFLTRSLPIYGKEGYDAFWGLDGPANIRFALGYAPTDHMVVTLGRSNVTDNLDLQLKFRGSERQNTNIRKQPQTSVRFHNCLFAALFPGY